MLGQFRGKFNGMVSESLLIYSGSFIMIAVTVLLKSRSFDTYYTGLEADTAT